MFSVLIVNVVRTRVFKIRVDEAVDLVGGDDERLGCCHGIRLRAKGGAGMHESEGGCRVGSQRASVVASLWLECGGMRLRLKLASSDVLIGADAVILSLGGRAGASSWLPSNHSHCRRLSQHMPREWNLPRMKPRRLSLSPPTARTSSRPN